MSRRIEKKMEFTRTEIRTVLVKKSEKGAKLESSVKRKYAVMNR